MDGCVICLESFSKNEQFSILTQKECNSIIKANANSSKKICPSIGDKVKVPNILISA